MPSCSISIRNFADEIKVETVFITNLVSSKQAMLLNGNDDDDDDDDADDNVDNYACSILAIRYEIE